MYYTFSLVMDDLLEECFLQAVKTEICKMDLPILTSTFYSAHMMPLCPENLRLDVKKSRFKKVLLLALQLVILKYLNYGVYKGYTYVYFCVSWCS